MPDRSTQFTEAFNPSIDDKIINCTVLWDHDASAKLRKMRVKRVTNCTENRENSCFWIGEKLYTSN